LPYSFTVPGRWQPRTEEYANRFVAYEEIALLANDAISFLVMAVQIAGGREEQRTKSLSQTIWVSEELVP
jgi:hypothetical protein